MTETPLTLDPARTAVVNVHWQNDIVTSEGAFAPFFAESVARHRIIPAARDLVEHARQAGMLVVWARAAFRPGYPELPLNTGLNHAIKDLGALVDGTRGAQIIDDMNPLDTEPVVSHPGTSAFPATALDDILRVRGINTILFTGVSTNITVEGTARDAANHRYRVVIVRDACAAATDEAHASTLETFSLLGRVASVEDIKSASSSPARAGV